MELWDKYRFRRIRLRLILELIHITTTGTITHIIVNISTHIITRTQVTTIRITTRTIIHTAIATRTVIATHTAIATHIDIYDDLGLRLRQSQHFKHF